MIYFIYMITFIIISDLIHTFDFTYYFINCMDCQKKLILLALTQTIIFPIFFR